MVGVISDTHGLIRPEALEALRGVDHILHAGDVGGSDVLEALQALAPTTAVRGNNDVGPWAAALPEKATVNLGGVRILVLHELRALTIIPAEAGIAAVVFGHSHQPRSERKAGVLYFNPGSAGPRRFNLPVTAGRFTICGTIEPETFNLLPLASSSLSTPFPHFPISRGARSKKSSQTANTTPRRR
jgi:uncharacterized protein